MWRRSSAARASRSAMTTASRSEAMPAPSWTSGARAAPPFRSRPCSTVRKAPWCRWCATIAWRRAVSASASYRAAMPRFAKASTKATWWCRAPAPSCAKATACGRLSGAPPAPAPHARAFSGKVDAGFPKENATKYEFLDRFPIQPNRKAVSVLDDHLRRPSRRGARLHRVIDQRLAQRPGGAGHAMRTGDDLVEGALDPRTVVVGEGQRRLQLHRMIAVAGHKAQNLVLLEQRNGDELAEQSGVHGLQRVPRRLELERARWPELDADHEALAAHVLHQFVALGHALQRGEQPPALLRRILHQALAFHHVEGGDAGR